VLDTTTMETLTIKWPESVNNSTTNYSYLIVGVHGGEITVRRLTTTKVGDKWEETHEICKAKFPVALKQFEEAAQIREIREKREREEEERRRREEEREKRKKRVAEIQG
ncbi:hypothetical protein PFISCL1PPCAC_9176, partial [Pristionchus fissidentatus]